MAKGNLSQRKEKKKPKKNSLRNKAPNKTWPNPGNQNSGGMW